MFLRWKSLSQLDIPKVVLGLTSADATERKNSRMYLDKNIIKTHVLDGFGSENDQIDWKHIQMLLLIIPLLVELLEYDYVEEKHLILVLLSETTRHYEYSLRFRDSQPWRIEIAKEIVSLVAQGMETYKQLSQRNSLTVIDAARSIIQELSEFEWL